MRTGRLGGLKSGYSSHIGNIGASNQQSSQREWFDELLHLRCGVGSSVSTVMYSIHPLIRWRVVDWEDQGRVACPRSQLRYYESNAL